MSHHFDTPTAQQDPRINVCDFYLFAGRPGMSVMAMTVNPDAGLSAPDTFHEEGLYAFRFDLDGDDREEVAFKVRFGPVAHDTGENRGVGGHAHRQSFEMRRATGADSVRGAAGELVVAGHTGTIAHGGNGAAAYAGLAPDLFAGDAAALGAFRKALFDEGRFDPGAFHNRTNFFARRNVTAIVLELPSEAIGSGIVRGWATASLYGHAPEIQVSRWGLPLVTNVFMPDAAMKEAFNRATPADDQRPFATQVAAVGETIARLAGSAADPAGIGRQLAARLFPTVLPYALGTPAAFGLAGFNGRALVDDVMDVIITLMAGTALSDGVAPDARRIREDFPYFGAPYTPAEQADVVPARLKTT